jgi:RNA polymerase sigma-70 factor (ECF subfamily)
MIKDEEDAIRRLKRGEVSGLETLVNLYQEKALQTAYLITGNRQMAEDVVQDSFLNVYRSIRHFDESRPFAPWFLRGVVNTAVKAAVSLKNEVHDEGDPLSTFEELLADGPSPEEQLESSDFTQRVWRAVQQLSPRQRAAVVQRYYLEMSEKEMASEMKAATGTIKWLLNDARNHLKVLLNPKGGTDER